MLSELDVPGNGAIISIGAIVECGHDVFTALL